MTPDHLVILPILLPLIASVVLLLLGERRRRARVVTSFSTTLVLVLVAWALLQASSSGAPARVYLLGDWPAPFGIVLVADRWSTMMLLLGSALGLAALLFSLARWDRAGPKFHTLFMLLLMGVNGSFLTGDLFNLFVFFEVLLAASYGLALHGSGTPRIKAGLHYVAVNLAASSLFLLGAALVYGTAGTLNMADLAVRVPAIAAADRTLFEIGCALTGMAFLTKAGMWPLGFWLTPTYSAASAPAAAVFSILTKVGIYVVVRLSTLSFGPDAGASMAFGDRWLFFGGLATIVFGALGVLASRTLSRIAGCCVFVSSGTLLAVVGTRSEETLSGGLYYLASSTLAVAAFFLLVELLNRARGTNAPVTPVVFTDEYRDPFETEGPADEIGVPLPLAIALLGGGFLLCVLLLVGLPPLSGFVGKLAIFFGLLHLHDAGLAWQTWVLIGVLTASSFATLVALVRAGIEVLWIPHDTPPPKVATVEFLAIAGLLGACVFLTIAGGPALRYMDETAASLHRPEDYVRAVLEAPRAAPSAQENAP